MNLQELSTPLTVDSISKASGCPLCGESRFSIIANYAGQSTLFKEKHVVRCMGCSFLYVDTMPSFAALSSYYQSGTYWGHVAQKTPFDIPTYHHQAHSRIAFLEKHITLKKQPRILDIGAGYSLIEEALFKKYPEAVLCAVEPDPQAAQSLKLMGVHVASALEAFSGQRFDLIIASHLLEHVNAPLTFLNALRDFAEPHGSLFVEVPNEDYRFKFSHEPHVLFFTPTTLKSVLERAHWTVDNIDTCGPEWQNERQRQLQNTRKQQWMRWIPWKNQLRVIKQSLLGKGESLSSMALPPDIYQCDTYGGDRIWIRAVAKPRSS